MHSCIPGEVALRTFLALQASGKRCSLFNRPISSPASYDDISPESDANVLTPSPKHSNSASKRHMTLKPILEMAN